MRMVVAARQAFRQGQGPVACAIHNQNARRDRTFVRLNCAAIPSGLLESELFGYEKGAFTGALAQKRGRIELAQEGSLFLDEIGDISLDLQPKLLRVLQKREFERLGSNQTVKVNVRLAMTGPGECFRRCYFRPRRDKITHLPALLQPSWGTKIIRRTCS